jgi:colicin import membrane protein
MRFLSFIFAILLHIAVVLAVTYSGSFTGRAVRVDLNRPVYEVRLVQKGKPVSLPGVKPLSAKKPPATPTAKNMAALKPVKAQPEPQKPVPEAISAKKAEQKKPPVKKEPTREEILAQAMKEARQAASKEKGAETDALKQALSEIQQEVGNRDEPQGHPDGLGDQLTGAVVTYIEYLQIEIRRNWRFPVMGSKELKATVEVRIDRSGRINGHRLLSRSGREDFDSSILRAVEQTELHHPPPANQSAFVITFHHDDLIQ